MNKRKKLLFIVEAMGGGVFTYLVNLTSQLTNYFDIYIAYALRPQTPIDYKNYFDKRVQFHEVKNFSRSINPIKDFAAFREIKKVAVDIQPDIIHLHSSKAGVLGRWAFNGHKISLFYTPHGYSFLMENYSQAKRSFYTFIEKIASKRICTTISCSPGEHEETLKLTIRAKCVNNGIDVEELEKLLSKCLVEPHPYTVFTLGRICHQKNPELFNEIAKKLPDVKFLWIGDGELRDKLTAKNIEITGWANRDVALQYAASADVFLLTSLWEGLPISLLEAMYMKKPCIVSDVIGNRDVIRNGINGFLCHDVLEFVNSINDCQEENSNILVEHAYQDIMNKYNTKVMANEYLKIYRQLAN